MNDKEPRIRGVLSGRFQIIATVGDEGSFAKVYVANDIDTGQRVAIKKFLKKTAVEADQLEREAEALGEISHPNVVKMICFGEGTYVHRSGQTQKWLFIALELAQAETLFDFVS